MASDSASADIVTSLIKQGGATEEDVVEVDISYDIIRHVSAQLYTNPRKAIEELICNSYDAGAKICYVTLPKDANGSLLVFDNGISMDLNGLKDLWRVAYSPKNKGEGKPRIENDRMQIGKFGVGKLAAFALGARLTHVACVNGNVRVVSVGQDDIRQKKGGKAPSFGVFKIPIEKAIPFLEPHFGDLPKPWQEGWETWTLALVQEIDPGNFGRPLKIGILRRMIMSALPISADFRVFLEGEEVPKKKIDPNKIEVKVDIIDQELRKKIRDALRSSWQVILGKEKPKDVPEKYCSLKVKKVQNPQNVNEKLDALIVPELGQVIGYSVITKTSLTTEKLAERGYENNGFAIHAYGKQINPEDHLFGISARSHRYWSRFFADVEITGLDRVLLVQRNAVSEKSNEAQIARTVMRTLFNYTRTKAEELEKMEEYKPESFGLRLRTFAPLIAPLALSGLAEGKLPKNGLDSLDVEFSSLGEAGPSARYDPVEQKILVNDDHPLIAALDDLGVKNRVIRHVIGEVLAGNQMAKGYLRSQNVSENIIEDTSEIIEVSIRTAAGFVRDEVEELIKDIDETSYVGGAPFENAVVYAFRSLRISATPLGAPEEPDGIVEIPISGGPSLRISVEAKGSKGVITHKELSEATVTRQSHEYGCENAIAIAREFVTEGRAGKESALLRETRGNVPLITTAGIAYLLRLHTKRPFTYDKIAEILTTWKHPDDLINFIEQVWKKMPDLGLMKLVLKVAHEQIVKDDTNPPEPGMILADDRVRKRKLKREGLIYILEAIQLTTHMILILNRPEYQFKMLAPYETILEVLQRDAEDQTQEVTEPPTEGRNKR